MFDVLSLPTGREVRLDWLFTRYSYDGLLESDTPTLNEQVLEQIEAEAEKLTREGERVVLIGPADWQMQEQDWQLPDIVLMGRFSSDVLEPHDPEQHASSALVLCWFAEGLGDGLERPLSEALSQLDWEALAVNCQS